MLGAFVHLPTLLGSQSQFLESAMDDDKEKSVIEKMVDKVNDAVENIVKAAVMPTTEEKPDPKQVAGTINEQVYIPEATDAAAMPAPLIPAKPVAKKKRKVPAKLTAAKIPPKRAAAKKASKKSSKKATKKTTKKPSKKSAKKTKAVAKKKAPKKAAKKKKAKR